MKMSADNPSAENRPDSGPGRTGSSSPAPEAGATAAGNGQPEPAIVGDGRLPSSSMRSYALLTPDLKEL